MATRLRPLEWVGSSRKDLKALPDQVRRRVGYALYRAQQGKASTDTKPLKGMGSNVVEVVLDHDRNTYRTVYTVRFASAVYVLHVFLKKSKTGIATPKHDIDLIRNRLKTAITHYRTNYGEEAQNA